MGILERFATTIKTDVHDLFGKGEAPTKPVEEYLTDMQQDLAEVQKELEAVKADEARAKQAVDQCNGGLARYDELARTALSHGEEDDARTYLHKKKEDEVKLLSLQEDYDTAKDSAAKLAQMQAKLESDIGALKALMAGEKPDLAQAAKLAQEADGVLAASNGATQEAAHGEPHITAMDGKVSSVDDDQAVEQEIAAMKLELGIDQ